LSETGGVENPSYREKAKNWIQAGEIFINFTVDVEARFLYIYMTVKG
jgi:hypothetical protein